MFLAGLAGVDSALLAVIPLLQYSCMRWLSPSVSDQVASWAAYLPCDTLL